jgi:hypothetical protein
MDAGLGRRIASDTDRLARTFAGSGVGLGALSANRKAPEMANSTIALDTLEALKIHANFPAEIAFDDILAILNGVDDLGELGLRQIFGAHGRVNFGFIEHDFRVARADAIDVAQSDIDALIRGNFYSDDTSHIFLNR